MLNQEGVMPTHWWAFGLRGAVAVVFGILCFALPGLTLGVLVLLFGAFALVDGVMSIISAIRSQGDHVWSMVLRGVLGILAGIVVFVWPGMTALVLVYFIAAWAVVTGVLEVFSAIRLRKVVNEWAWIIGGVLSVLFGVLIMANPGAGALALVWVIGIFAILEGITLFVMAWRVHELEEAAEHGGHPGGESLHQPAAP
jgi:uncharacterized membrane protein HdeD (DUF308 family)